MREGSSRDRHRDRAPGWRRGGPSAAKCAHCAGWLWLGFPSSFLLPLGIGGLAVARVPLEGAGDRELAEPVPDHVLVDQHWHVLASVVDGEPHPDHVRAYHGAPRP